MENHVINSKMPIASALAKLNKLSGEAMVLIAVDDAGRAVGTLTDGDIRRSLLQHSRLGDSVSSVMQRRFRYIMAGDTDIKLWRSFRRQHLRLIPVLNPDMTIARLIDLEKTRALLPLSALIMAGGRGERLRPMTLTIPKPLLKIEGKAIIDYNIEALAEMGIDDITVSAGYLAEQIEEHFSRPVNGINVRCIREDIPLGTIGVLGMIHDFAHDNVLVMNSDLLTDVAFDEMMTKHIESGADITVAVIPYTVSVPYAILATDSDRVTSIEEKPTYSYYANGGIYIINRRAASLIPADVRYDATDLIERAIGEGMKVTYFPINGTWIDVGTPADFSHAADIMKYNKKKS